MPWIIFIVGISLFGLSYPIATWNKWTPVSFPIDLRPGISRSPAFSIDLSSDYLIELEVERKLPFEQINCLLGVSPLPNGNCVGIESPVDLRWVVSSLGRKIAEGSSEQEHGGAWSTSISRTIGRFRGDKGQEYRVQVESLKDASVLTSSNPRITVGVHSIKSKGYYAFAQITGWIGIALASVGLIWVFIGLARRSRPTEAGREKSCAD
jgi:hypothetical protein